MDAPYEGRVFAVTINNIYDALPHHGLSQADMYFEMFVNDYCTRGLAFFSDIAKMESVGPVRSYRHNFNDICLGYDTIVLHAGNEHLVDGVDHYRVDYAYGYRDTDRYYNRDYAWEHTLFVTGDAAIELSKAQYYDLNRKDVDYGMLFAEVGTPAGGTAANEIEIVFTLKGRTKTSTMKFDADLGKYVYWQYGLEMIDENNSQKAAFENVIVMLAPTYNYDVYHIAELEGTGEGYYACNGQLIPIKWGRDSKTDPFSYTLADGTPLTLGVGSTFVAIAPTGSPVNVK